MARKRKKSKAKKAAAPRVAKKKKLPSKMKSAVKKKRAKKRAGSKASLERAAARPEEIASALAAAAVADVVEADAAGLADEVAIPPVSTFNEGLQSAPRRSRFRDDSTDLVVRVTWAGERRTDARYRLERTGSF